MKDTAEKGIKQAISKIACLFLALLRGQLEAVFVSGGGMGESLRSLLYHLLEQCRNKESSPSAA